MGRTCSSGTPGFLRHVRWFMGVACLLMLSGCATERTLVGYRQGDPLFFSGTRLDVAAIRQNGAALQRFHTIPPAWPWFDLPFSFTADLVFFSLPETPEPPPGSSGGR